MSTDIYQAGGSLSADAPTYVERLADRDLYKSVIAGEYCYIFNSRQMGKSSLRVKTMQKLQEDNNVVCAAVDLTMLGTYQVTPEQWYGGLINNLVDSFELEDKFDLANWLNKHKNISPVQRLDIFIQNVLLQKIQQKIVIFIDEIDSILQLGFNSDFLGFIRGCYNKKANKTDYKRLTFVLLGVVTPYYLIRKNRTPFNIGKAIELHGFKEEEAQQLVRGLEGKVDNPKLMLKKILSWTGGQPFLTQKLCQLVARSADNSIRNEKEEEAWLEQLLQSQIIENWESQDEPEHLRTIRDRILYGHKTSDLLKLYQKILQQGEIAADDSPEQMELRLSGLVVKQQGKLKVYNRLYKRVFNPDWINKALTEYGNLDDDFSSTSQPDDLSSDRNVDYTRLCDLLANGHWKQADEETLVVMLKATGREKEGWLGYESITNFPCTDLRTIDQLWVKYSNGRFGFSVQKHIWESVNSDYETFGDRVGWRKGWWMNKEWITYSEVTFDTSAPIGHLPIFYLEIETMHSISGFSDPRTDISRHSDFFYYYMIYSLSRIQTCKL